MKHELHGWYECHELEEEFVSEKKHKKLHKWCEIKVMRRRKKAPWNKMNSMI